MKCENCELNCNDNNYCKIDGNYIDKNEKNKNEIINQSVCNNCGKINEVENLYCKICGNKLYELKDSEKRKCDINNLNKKSKIINNITYYINKTNIKSKVIPPAASILLLIIIAIFMKLLINIMGLSIGGYTNIFNIVLGLNLVPINLVSSSFVGVGNINISIGMIIYLVVPFICIFISNIVFIKKENIKESEILKDSFIISIIYGLILGIISFLGRNFITANLNEYYSLSIIIKYSFIKSIVNGTIISFLPTYIILFKKVKPKLSKFKLINKVLKTVVLIYITIIIFLIISVFLNNTKGIQNFIAIPQIGVYILQAVNLIPIAILNTIISIFNIGDVNMYLSENMNLLIYSLMLITIIIFIITGYELKSSFKNKYVIKYFSLIYSITIGIIVYLSKIDTSGSLSLLELQNYESYSYIGASVILGITISFLYSYSIIALGYRLNKE